jgi:hypothetical protein
MDRLEVGAIVSNTPFSKVGELDHAVVQIKATRSILKSIDKLTLVVNDYVVFEIKKSDIAKWYSPMPPMGFQVTQGHMDPSSGKLSSQTTVASGHMAANPGMPDDFKKYSFFAASFSPKFAMPPFDQLANLKLADADVRIHHILGIGMHKAGKGEQMVMVGQLGWLPKESP